MTGEKGLGGIIRLEQGRTRQSVNIFITGSMELKKVNGHRTFLFPQNII